MRTRAQCCKIPLTIQKGQPIDARLSQSEVRSAYDRISGVYDLWGNLAESRARRRAIELADISDGQSILEVAVGTGLAFAEIVKRNPGGFNVGIDISEGMLNRARRLLSRNRATNYELNLGSAFSIPYPDAHFDLLVNNYMFDLIPYKQMEQVIAEFRRVLRSNGRLILVNMTESENLFGHIYELIYRISPRALGGCRGVQMSERLRESGFVVERREYVEQLLFPSEIILTRKK